jgi:spermidine/putrescine transport system ATP-binding protein
VGSGSAWRELGITFICVTHSQSEAFAMASRVAILNEGRVQQVGAPQDIYRRSANRFVAEFVGCNNIIAGTISAVDGASLVLVSALGEVRAPAAGAALAKGAPVSLIVPADRIELLAAPLGSGNEVAAQVATLEFLGSTVTVFLETADGGELRTQRPLQDIERMAIAVGQPVVAHWSPTHGYLLKN